jgi:ABC-2 type transport system ATP-binding protein
MAMSEYAVEVHSLFKSYGPVEAVNGVDMQVRCGEVFALIGPNGAGKTTTLEILEGHRDRDSGEVSVLGYDPEQGGPEMRERIGIVLQSTSVSQYLRVEEAVDMFRGYYPHPRPLDEILELTGLADDRRRLVRRLSGGQQRRLDVAIGLAGDPDLLFLDEPTTGFDPSARRAAWEMIRGLRSLGKTVLLTTHYMDEAQALADRVAVIGGGRIVAQGTPDELRARYNETSISFRPGADAKPLPAELAALSVGEASARDGRISLVTTEPTRTLHALTSWALESGTPLDDLSVTRLSLEDVYLRLSEEPEEEAP